MQLRAAARPLRCVRPGHDHNDNDKNDDDHHQDLITIARQKAEAGLCQEAGAGGRPGRGQCGVREVSDNDNDNNNNDNDVTQGQCGKGLASVYHEEVISVGGQQRRLVVTNGIPSHTYHDYTGTNRQLVIQGGYNVNICLLISGDRTQMRLAGARCTWCCL